MRNSNSKSHSRGAALLEFILITPLFVVFVLAIIQLALAYTVQSELDRAVSSALTVAATTPGLDAAPQSCVNESQAPYCIALQRIREAVVHQLRGGLVGVGEGSSMFARVVISDENPEIIFPETDSGETPLEAMARAPLTIRLRAQVSSVVPILPRGDFRGVASGFREIRSAQSYPILTDCNGNPIGSSSYQQDPCDCSQIPNSVWNSASMTCEVCTLDRSPVYNGALFNWQDLTASACWCPSSARCVQLYGVGAQSWHAGNYRCVCGCNQSTGGFQGDLLSGTTNTGCTCAAAPATYPGGSYSPQHSFTGKFLDGASSICKCTPELTVSECQQWFPGLQVGVSNDKCMCNCTATCLHNVVTPTGTWSNGLPDQHWNAAAGCQCRCNIQHPGNQWTIDPNRTYTPGVGCGCSNTCPPGQQPDESDVGCGCTCAPVACGQYAIQNPATCGCVCINPAETYPGCTQGQSGGG